MEIEWLCSEILHAATDGNGRPRIFRLPTRLILDANGDGHKKTEIEAEFGATREEIRKAFEVLIEMRLFKHISEDYNAIMISRYGEYVRVNGGFARVAQEKRQKEVDESIIGTNGNINRYTKWQFVISIFSILFSAAALSVSIYVGLKESPTRYILRFPKEETRQSQKTKTKSCIQEVWIYADSTASN